MFRHPWEMEQLVRFRIAALEKERRGEPRGLAIPRADLGWVRRQVGLRLIALGERLAGPVGSGLHPARPV